MMEMKIQTSMVLLADQEFFDYRIGLSLQDLKIWPEYMY